MRAFMAVTYYTKCTTTATKNNNSNISSIIINNNNIYSAIHMVFVYFVIMFS